MDGKNIILDIRNLRTQFKTYEGRVHAVNGITYSIHEGETVGIVGESGCGKSVSMLSVMRLLSSPPAHIEADSIKFMGKELTSLSKNEIRKIRGHDMAMIFQDPMTSLNPVLTIGYQLSEPLMFHFGMSKQKARARAEELLRSVGIPAPEKRLDDYPHQLSGGMRQRVMIAIGLSCNPSLLIADEPTTALDVTIQAQLVDLVKSLRNELGMALIWITHDLGVIASLAGRVLVMYAGFVVEDAPVKELYAAPQHPYTAALLRSLPRLDGSPGQELEIIKGFPPDLLNFPQGCPFAPRCKYAQEKCIQERPDLVEISPNHHVACWVDMNTGELR